jgi:hypothetical protein
MGNEKTNCQKYQLTLSLMALGESTATFFKEL